MNYYIQGDAAKADQIKAAFEKLGYDVRESIAFGAERLIMFTMPTDNKLRSCAINSDAAYLITRLAELGDYKELELPVEPKFKAKDRIVNKSDKSTVYRIIALHEEFRKYIVDIEHKVRYESCPWIAFEDQDDYELAPKPHYDIANFHAGMPVLVRETSLNAWQYVLFSHCYIGGDGLTRFDAGLVGFTQCIPFEGNEHLLGTTDMCDEQYINW